jgi:tol-pal system protein YbgF
VTCDTENKKVYGCLEGSMMFLRENLHVVGIIFLSFLVLGGCAPQAQVGMLERQVSGLLRENQQLNHDMSVLKAKVEQLEGMNYGGGALAQIRKRQATLDNRLAAVQADLYRISGQLDMMQHEGRGFVPATVGGSVASNSTSVPGMVTGMDENRPEDAGRKQHVAVSDVPDNQNGSTDLYESGLELLKQGNFMEAKQTFMAFVKANPRSQRVANAYFWSGECEYRMNRFEEAILEYQKVISRYASSNKVPDALLKQGLAFLKLGDRESARIVLEKLVARYPASPQAVTARKKLKRMR